MCLQLKSNLSHYVMKRVISTAKNEIWRSILVIQSENFFTINFSFEKVVLGHKHTENMLLLLITAKVEIGSKKNSDKCSENQANHCLFAHRFLEWFSGNWVTFLLDVRKIWVNQPSFFISHSFDVTNLFPLLAVQSLRMRTSQKPTNHDDFRPLNVNNGKEIQKC